MILPLSNFAMLVNVPDALCLSQTGTILLLGITIIETTDLIWIFQELVT